MQAQKSAPDYMEWKDKFLIQDTIVPYGTTEEEITSACSLSLVQLVKNVEDAKIITNTEELIFPNVVENVKSVLTKNAKLKPDKDEDFMPDKYEESRQVKS
ncbi:unnamed protein product [Fraxinus pennsylvanica]|uniref:Uncharacterized protein n=1 Tax=Fraxinus pennsylvanica TaxID=56036 RepID=A0AAD1ZL26_9LAMI|nr:unnamed protein product [Fraxinus pennsylvanica]